MPGDLTEQGLGVDDSVLPADLKLDHVFHLAAVYDIEADEATAQRANVEGTRHAIEFANSRRRRALPPRQLDRRRRRLPRRVPGGHARRGPAAAPPLPPHEVRVGADGAARRRGADARLPAGDRRRPLANRRDRQDRRPLLPLHAAQEAARRAARLGAARRAGGRQDHDRPGRLRRARDGPHRPPARRRPAGRHLPPRRPRADDRRRRAQLLRQGGARPAAGDARRREPDQGGSRARPRRDHGAADGQEDPQPDLPRPRHPAGGDGGTRLQVHLRRPRHPARAERDRHRGAAARQLRGAAVGLLGAQPRPRAVPRPLAGERDPGQARGDHRRLVGDRARDRAAGRRGRRRS